jgi:hypothetical protein
MTDVPALSPPAPTPHKRRIPLKVVFRILDLVGAVFWIYALIKVFWFDIDIAVIEAVDPGLSWLVEYRLLIFLGLLLIALVLTRSITLLWASAYVAVFPFIILFWKIPYAIFRRRNWLVAFAIVNALVGMIQSVRRSLIMTCVFIIAAVAIVATDTPYLAYPAVVAILLVLGRAYLSAGSRAFKPSAVYALYKEVFPRIRSAQLFNNEKSLRGLPVEAHTSQQLATRVQHLQMTVIYNRVCLFLAKKLRTFQSSRVQVLAYVAGLFILLLFSAVSFGFVNFALYKQTPDGFLFTYGRPDLFGFIYYATFNMFYQASGIVPVAVWAQALQLFQFLCALVLIGFFGTIFLSIRSDQYSADLGQVIGDMEREANSVDEVLRAEFNIGGGIDAAIEALKAAQAGLTSFILYMSKVLDEGR